MFASLASLASVLSALSPAACVAIAYVFTLAIVACITGAPFAASQRSAASLMLETSDSAETDFFGSEIGSDVLAAERSETDERAPLLPFAPSVSVKAPSAYPARMVRQCWAIDAGPQWGTYYVKARNFRQAAEALRAAFVAMDDPDIGAPDLAGPDVMVRPVSFVPVNAPLILAD
jgi:hypothetical protein